jgi:transposase
MHVAPLHTPDELRALIRAEKRARVTRRLQAVLAAREGETADAIGERVQLSDRAVHRWVGRYNASGLAGLADKPGRGRKKPLTPGQEETFKARIRAGATVADGVCALRGEDVRTILRAEFGVVRGLQATYDLLHALGFSCLRPRPKHPKADPAAQEAFRKKRPTPSPGSPPPTPAKPSRSGSRTRPGSAKRGR